MELDLGTVKSNFQEIYTAVHDDKADETELVANLWGTRVYYASAGWGRVWRLFYLIVGIFIGDNFKLSRLKDTIQKTHGIFQEQLKVMEAYTAQYHYYMKNMCEGYTVNEGEYAECRWAITEWNDSTRPFLKLVQKNQNNKMKKLFQMCFGTIYENGKESPFHPGALCKDAWQYQRIIDFEGIMNSPLPLKILGMAATKKTLIKEEAKLLGKWIEKINEAGDSIEVRQFHRMIISVAEHIKKHHSSIQAPDVVNLELSLTARNCNIFLQKDPKHIKWRESLKKGDVLQSNGKEIILGDRIGKKAIGDDGNYIFTVQNDPDTVVMIGINEAVLALKQKLSADYEWGVKSVQFHHLDPHGRFAVVERLHDPLGSHQWTSTEDVMTAEDQDAASPLAVLLDWMVKQEKSPLNFSPKYLMFDKDGQLKSLKITMEKYKKESEEDELKVEPDFDYNALEQFAYDCAGGNLRIYKYLMDCSGLKSHKNADYYAAMVDNGLKGELITAQNEAGIAKITDPRVSDRGGALSKEVVKLREKCCLNIQKKVGDDLPKNMTALVNDKILYFYGKNRSAGILWPTMETQVVDSIIEEIQGSQ